MSAAIDPAFWSAVRTTLGGVKHADGNHILKLTCFSAKSQVGVLGFEHLAQNSATFSRTISFDS